MSRNNLDTILSARVPDAVLNGLDRIAAERSTESFGGRKVSRADVVRQLLIDGVAAHAPAPAARSRVR